MRPRWLTNPISFIIGVQCFAAAGYYALHGNAKLAVVWCCFGLADIVLGTM